MTHYARSCTCSKKKNKKKVFIFFSLFPLPSFLLLSFIIIIIIIFIVIFDFYSSFLRGCVRVYFCAVFPALTFCYFITILFTSIFIFIGLPPSSSSLLSHRYMYFLLVSYVLISFLVLHVSYYAGVGLAQRPPLLYVPHYAGAVGPSDRFHMYCI